MRRDIGRVSGCKAAVCGPMLILIGRARGFSHAGYSWAKTVGPRGRSCAIVYPGLYVYFARRPHHFRFSERC